MLLFLSVFMLPLVASLVAGDIVANEDGNGTLKTILTRSVDRGQVLAAKALAAMTYAAIAVFLSHRLATVAGVASWGFHPLRTALGHGRLGLGSAPAGVRRPTLLYLIPLVAVVAIGVLLSTVHRNSAAAVVGNVGLVLMLYIVAADPGPRRHQALPAHRTVPGLAGTASHADGLGAHHPLVWVCALYGSAGSVRRLPRLPAPRRRRRLSANHGGPVRACGQPTSAASSTSSSSTSPIRRRASRGSISPAPMRAVDSAPQATPKRRQWSGARPS